MMLGFNALHDSLQITDSKQSADCVIACGGGLFPRHGRYVINADRYIHAIPGIQSHRCRHVDLSVVMIGFSEAGFIAADIAEMNEKDFIGKCRDRILQPFSHQMITCLTKGDAEMGRRNHLYSSPNRFQARKDPGDTSE